MTHSPHYPPRLLSLHTAIFLLPTLIMTEVQQRTLPTVDPLLLLLTIQFIFTIILVRQLTSLGWEQQMTLKERYFLPLPVTIKVWNAKHKLLRTKPRWV